MRYVSVAPSNIAIVKYMGKVDFERNLPANDSVSLTLSSLHTICELDCTPPESGSSFVWTGKTPACIKDPRYLVPRLEGNGLKKVERHVDRVVQRAPHLLAKFGLGVRLGAERAQRTLSSANSFPAAAGIASSASSFAAITAVVLQSMSRDPNTVTDLLKKNSEAGLEFRRAMAQLSREGSGSSCRSFEGPWVRWSGDQVEPLDSTLAPLSDLIVLCGTSEKLVSSSEAHTRVLTSPLWEGRVERANARATDLTVFLAKGEHNRVADLAWEEFWEMHSLFHTSKPPFTYWEPETLRVLKWCESARNKARTQGILLPIVTMDAGANVHILVESNALSYWQEQISQGLAGLKLLTDTQGWGVSLLPVTGS